MNSVQPRSPRETELHSPDHVCQAGTPHGRPFNHTTIDPKLLQNVPTKEASIFHFQSVLLPVPSQSDLILPQPSALELACQVDATALVRVNGSGPDNTSKHQNKHQETNTSEWEQNTNAAVQDALQAPRPYSSEHVSQFMGTLLTSNVTSYDIPTTNPQPESDLLQTQPQSEFQGTTNVFKRIRHSEVKWQSVRAVITRLYLEEDKTLSQIMEIMKIEYDFQASSVSYSNSGCSY